MQETNQSGAIFRRIIPFLVLSFALLIVLAQTHLASRSAQASESIPLITPNGATSSAPNCRYGATPLGSDQIPLLNTLKAGWYVTFGSAAGSANPGNGAQFVPVILVKQQKDGAGNYYPQYLIGPDGLTGSSARTYVKNLVSNNPGALWLVGNEVDRGPDPDEIESGQGDVFPDIYARAYHDVYYWIKEEDPTAQVAVSGLVQVTPGRLQYLDLMWNAYLNAYGTPMPVDVWNIHLYILPEVNPQGEPNGIANVALGTDPTLGRRESGGVASVCGQNSVYCFAEHDSITIFTEQIIDMRTWMKEHGQQNKPLILTEYSILYPYEEDGGSCFLQDEHGNCFTEERVHQFMVDTFNFMETAVDPNLGYPLDNNKLIQQWMWFAVYTPYQTGSASQLFDENLVNLTTLGQQFQTSANASATPPNLLIERVNTPVIFTGGGGTGSATLSVNIRNNGNTDVTVPFTVRFYANSALTQEIGSVVVNPTVRGCTNGVHTASVNWDNLTPGPHSYWVKIDSGNAVSETNEGDNIGQGIVLVDPQQVLLPIVRNR
ncbi:MAG: CARDB domain-containing protein [Chloroflexota bacterium]